MIHDGTRPFRPAASQGARWLRATRVLWSLGLLALLVTPASAQMVKKITVVGAQTVQPAQVLAWTGLEVDRSVSRESVATAIRKLFATGKFADVFVYETPAPGGVELIFNVAENPRLAALRFVGLDKLDQEDLEEGLDLRIGDFIAPSQLRGARESIRDKYRAEGYYNAEVTTDSTTFLPGGKVDLVFRIDEKKKVQVREIHVTGASGVPADKIIDVMETERDGWFSSGTFKAPVFDEDLQRIVDHYKDNGYLDAQVVSHRLEFLAEDNKLDIHLEIEEGDLHRVGTVTWSGNTVFGDERIEPLVELENGDIFRESDFQSTVYNLQNVYWSDGYIYIVVTPSRSVRDNVVDVSFRFQEGEPARVRQIQVAGNSKTHERVIRRQMRLYPGEVFDSDELQGSQRDIFQLGFFNDVRADFRQTPKPEDIDVILEVEEKQTGQFTMGVGFSQQTQASGFFNIGENNLFGRGQSLQFAWQFGRRQNFLDVSFTEPWFMGTPTSVGIDVFNRYSNRIRDFYDTRVAGFATRVGRPIPGTRYSRASVRYSLTETTLRNFDPFYVETLDELERELGTGGIEFQRLDKVDWPQTSSSVTLTLSRNSTDNPFFPTRGSRSTGSWEVSGGPFGGDLDFQKYLVDYDTYQPLPGRLAFHLGTSVGYLARFGSGDSVPDYERFRLGGNRFFKLRGYRDLQVVPQGNPSFVGGNFFTTFTTEVLYPVTRAVHLLGFVDQGDTWNTFSEADLTNLRTGAGFGIRLEVPLVGRIGLDFGYGFDKTDPGWETHFNFGSIF